MYRGKTSNFLHLENPVRQPLKDIFTIMASELRLQRPFMVPFEQWLQSVTTAEEVGVSERRVADAFVDRARRREADRDLAVFW